MPSRSPFNAAGKWPNRPLPGSGSPRDEGDRLLLSKEAAIYCRLSHRTLERLRIQGGGPPYLKLGPGKRARVLYHQSDLDTWLARYRHQSTSEYRHRENDAAP